MYLLPGTLLTIKGSVHGSKGWWDRRNWEERSGCNGQLLEWVWCVCVCVGVFGRGRKGCKDRLLTIYKTFPEKSCWRIKWDTAFCAIPVEKFQKQQNIWYSCPKGIPDGMFQTDNLCSIILLKPI